MSTVIHYRGYSSSNKQATYEAERLKNHTRPTTSKSSSSLKSNSRVNSAGGRPTTAEYDRALTQDIMEEGGEPANPVIFGGQHGAGPLSSTKVKLGIGGGIVLFVVVLSAVLIVDSVHTIEEGNVGIYFVQGALSNYSTQPGVHWSVPFVTVIEEITIRPQTETLEDITTVTRDGIQNTFHNIQVLSNVDEVHLIPLIRKFGMDFRRALVYDRVAEELRTYCANHTVDEVYNTLFLEIVSNVKRNVETSIERLGMSGIKLLNLVIPKPDIPRDIASNYKAVKVQWTEQLVATQQQKTEKIKKETESIKALLDAEREKDVLEIELQKQLLKKEREKEVNDLEIQIIKSREENQANVDAYKKEKEAEANKNLYSADYVKLEMAKALSDNTKFYFSGETSPLGALLNKILGDS